MSANNEQFSESPCLMQIKMMLKIFLLGSHFSFYIFLFMLYIYIFFLFFYFSIFLFFNISIFLFFYVCCALIRMIARACRFQRVDLLLCEFV